MAMDFDAFVVVMQNHFLVGDAQAASWQFTGEGNERIDRAHRGTLPLLGWVEKLTTPHCFLKLKE